MAQILHVSGAHDLLLAAHMLLHVYIHAPFLPSIWNEWRVRGRKWARTPASYWDQYSQHCQAMTGNLRLRKRNLFLWYLLSLSASDTHRGATLRLRGEASSNNWGMGAPWPDVNLHVDVDCDRAVSSLERVNLDCGHTTDVAQGVQSQ